MEIRARAGSGLSCVQRGAASTSDETATSVTAVRRFMISLLHEGRRGTLRRRPEPCQRYGLECPLLEVDMIRTILGILILAAAPALAQTPNHKHYADSPDAEKPGPGGELAPRLQNLRAHVFPVTTKSRQAQLFMSQGLNLAYGFNHAEAGRAFRDAARLDPGCAMAYWGQAF